MKAEDLWCQFQHSLAESADNQGRSTDFSNISYEAWQFGAAPDELADLVRRGVKTATSSAYLLYEIEEEPLPQMGSYHIILDSRDQAVCIIQIKRVYVTSFCEVTRDHAYKEGEGDRSLAYWQAVHETFFTSELASFGGFSKEMKVVCEEFEVVFSDSFKQ